jgi:hypothetical protein
MTFMAEGELSASLDDLIEKGKYWMVHMMIQERLASKRLIVSGTRPRLFDLGKRSPKEAAKIIMTEGYIPGTIGDLVYFGRNNPFAWMCRSVVAPGTVHSNMSPYIVSFRLAPWKRMLDLGSYHREFEKGVYLGVKP